MPADSHIALWISFLLYGASLLFAVWRLAMGLPHRRTPKLLLIIPGFLFHTYDLWQRGYIQGRCPVGTLFETFIFIAWCLIAIHLVVMSFMRINFLTVFYMPIVLIIQLAALVIPERASTPFQHNYLLGVHASVITLGYAAFFIAGALGTMYLVQESQLRRHRIGSLFMLLPPIVRLDAVQGWLVAFGFLLLTFGLGSGVVGLKSMYPNGVMHDVKLVWSFAVWGIYLALLIGRYFWKLQGRAMAYFTMLSCIFVLATFWISNLLSTFHRY